MTATLSSKTAQDSPEVEMERPSKPRIRPSGIAPLLVLAAATFVAVMVLSAVAIVEVARDNTTGPSLATSEEQIAGADSAEAGHSHEDGAAHSSRSSASVTGAREITVKSSSFRFEPAEVRVGAGEQVTIALTSKDILHDFVIDDPAFHVEATRATPGRGGLRAPSTPGRYTVYCSVAGHREAGMVGTLVVEPR